MIRLFVAVNHSVAVTRRIADEIEKLKPAVRDALRVVWVPAANLHLTLRFLGSAPEEAVAGVAGRLGRIAEQTPPFELRARGLGAFPSHERPRVLWFGADGGDALVKLQREVEAAMVELGFPAEDRPFHPHVTVGRVKEQHGDSPWPAQPELEAGASSVTELVVYESKTRSQGAEYLACARVPLLKKENL